MTTVQDFWFVCIAVLGASLGSFLNVVGYRMPRGESIVYPGSHCVHCAQPLQSYELIPMLSWLALGGKCRTCGQPISVRYPLLEAATACLYGATFLAIPAWPARLGWMVFWLLLMAAVCTDIYAMKVPNALTMSGAVIMFVVSVCTGLQSWMGATIGLTVCFVLLLMIHLLSGGHMGLGDVKLYLSIGAALGAVHGIESLVFASFYGTVMGLALRTLGWLQRRQYIPFVPFIAMGVVTAVFWGQGINDWYLHAVLGATWDSEVR
jgi:prepilin signal peptidase PulO-like enzyme (type II secretory pathway)